MLVIREAQMKSLGDNAQDRFAARLCDIFAQAYPRECRQAGGRPAMLHWARIGLKSAVAAGYRSQFESARWLALMLILGVDFAVDPQLPWVGSSSHYGKSVSEPAVPSQFPRFGPLSFQA